MSKLGFTIHVPSKEGVNRLRYAVTNHLHELREQGDVMQSKVVEVVEGDILVVQVLNLGQEEKVA